jgi:hypothetical protein
VTLSRTKRETPSAPVTVCTRSSPAMVSLFNAEGFRSRTQTSWPWQAYPSTLGGQQVTEPSRRTHANRLYIFIQAQSTRAFRVSRPLWLSIQSKDGRCRCHVNTHLVPLSACLPTTSAHYRSKGSDCWGQDRCKSHFRPCCVSDRQQGARPFSFTDRYTCLYHNRTNSYQLMHY